MYSFTLLDDSNASSANPTSRLYTDLRQVLSCTDAAQFESMIDQMQVALEQGLYAVAVFAYELGAELCRVGTVQQGFRNACIPPAERTALARAVSQAPKDFMLLCPPSVANGGHKSVPTLRQPSHILIYKQCQQLSQEEVTNWLKQQAELDGNHIAGIANLHANVNEQDFTNAIDRIQHYITEGDTYQVNYTFRFHFQTYGNIFSLYSRLRQRQSVPFGALILLPDDSVVLSLSPELFIKHSDGQLEARPMKGTLPSSTTHDENVKLVERLSSDEKNRAENIMIVDLLRNDLGRIAKPGSIKVPRLFEVERFNSVLQMTSTVIAQCREEVSLVNLLKAIYPCGSITGAPKIRTMQIIHELETEPRGVYTGAIGWFDPVEEGKRIPEFCLSVPIRTMQLEAPDTQGLRRSVLGVGAGIVFDSVASSEYQECLLKARFVTELPAQFSLFETMYATKENGCRHWDRHVARLAKSAHFFGIPLNLSEIEKQIELACNEFENNAPYRLKLSIGGMGQIQIQSAVFESITTPAKILLSSTPQQSQSIWLQHKTTQRTLYDQAWRAAEEQGAFDMLFCNERGELTEGGRSNLLVKLDGCWYTPPLSAGVLAGVMRSVLMDDPTWKLTERSISVDDLNKVEEVAVCNALRGVVAAVVPTLQFST